MYMKKNEIHSGDKGGGGGGLDYWYICGLIDRYYMIF